MRKLVVDHYVKEGQYETLAAKYVETYAGQESFDVDSELTADNLFNVMAQEGFLQRYAAEDAQTVKTLKNTLSAFIRHINDALRKLTRTNEIHREIYASLNRDKQFFEKLRVMATKALDALPSAQDGTAAGTKRAEGKTNKKYSLRPGAAEDVRRALENKKYTEDVYLTESSPAIITSQKGAKNYPLLMRAGHLRENILTEDEARVRGLDVNKGINYHGLGIELFLQVIKDLDNVTEAYRGTKNAEKPDRRENYFLLISQHSDIHGNTINVAIHIDKKGQFNRVMMDANKIATVFGREGLREYIQREKKKGNLVRIKSRDNQVSELSSPIENSYNKVISTNNISRGQAESQEKLSLKPVSSISEENRRLIEENETYKAVIAKLNRQIAALQKKVVDPKGVRKLARDVRAEYRSTIPQAELEQKLTDLFDYIANEQDLDFGEITRITAEIAKSVIEQSSALNTELTEQYKELRDRLKTSKIQLTSLQKSEMAVQFDSYENFRRKNFGKIRFTKDGVKLDELWGELCEKWPEFFRADEHEAAYDLALRIYDAYLQQQSAAALRRGALNIRSVL